MEQIGAASVGLRDTLQSGMQRAMRVTMNAARINAPVDRGRLRASITSLAEWRGDILEGVVGTNVEYAPYMEYGTGRLTDGEGGKGGRHWPPGAALDVWARRHGFASGRIVAEIIGRRGGLKPRQFLRKAFNVSLIVSTIRAEAAKFT